LCRAGEEELGANEIDGSSRGMGEWGNGRCGTAPIPAFAHSPVQSLRDRLAQPLRHVRVAAGPVEDALEQGPGAGRGDGWGLSRGNGWRGLLRGAGARAKAGGFQAEGEGRGLLRGEVGDADAPADVERRHARVADQVGWGSG